MSLAQIDDLIDRVLSSILYAASYSKCLNLSLIELIVLILNYFLIL